MGYSTEGYGGILKYWDGGYCGTGGWDMGIWSMDGWCIGYCGMKGCDSRCWDTADWLLDGGMGEEEVKLWEVGISTSSFIFCSNSNNNFWFLFTSIVLVLVTILIDSSISPSSKLSILCSGGDISNGTNGSDDGSDGDDDGSDDDDDGNDDDVSDDDDDGNDDDVSDDDVSDVVVSDDDDSDDDVSDDDVSNDDGAAGAAAAAGSNDGADDVDGNDGNDDSGNTAVDGSDIIEGDDVRSLTPIDAYNGSQSCNTTGIVMVGTFTLLLFKSPLISFSFNSSFTSETVLAIATPPPPLDIDFLFSLNFARKVSFSSSSCCKKYCFSTSSFFIFCCSNNNNFSFLFISKFRGVFVLLKLLINLSFIGTSLSLITSVKLIGLIVSRLISSEQRSFSILSWKSESESFLHVSSLLFFIVAVVLSKLLMSLKSDSPFILRS